MNNSYTWWQLGLMGFGFIAILAIVSVVAIILANQYNENQRRRAALKYTKSADEQINEQLGGQKL